MTITTGSLCLTEILMSRKPCSSNSDASHSADSTSASGVALPYFCQQPRVQRAGVDADPDRGAGVGGRLGDLLDLVVELLDVARVDPDRGAAGVDRGEDVLRLEVDVRDDRDLRLPRDRRPARRRRPASGRPPGRSGSRRRSARRSAAAWRRCRRSASSSSTAPRPVRRRPRRPMPTWILRLTRRSASLVGTDGIPREIAVICCATPRCGSRSRDRRAPVFEITAPGLPRAHRAACHHEGSGRTQASRTSGRRRTCGLVS